MTTADRGHEHIAVVGHVCVDLTPSLSDDLVVEPGAIVPVGPLGMTAGGCVANVGLDLIRLGRPVALAADIGDDVLGAWLGASLERSGANTTGIRTTPAGQTSYSIVLEAPGGDRSFLHHVGSNETFDASEVTMVDSSIVHLGYPSVLPRLLANGAARLEQLLIRAREHGVATSVDLATVDSVISSDGRSWRDVLAKFFPLVDVVSPSATDLVTALGLPTPRTLSDLRSIARVLVDMGAAVALVTGGSLGVALRTAPSHRLSQAGRCVRDLATLWADHDLVLPAQETRVKRTTGAGDAASAALLDAILSGFEAPAALEHVARTAAAKVAGNDRLAFPIGEDPSALRPISNHRRVAP